ncbi:hypothetical protein FS842_006103 [Serendipita sp. 407]|nr:hypothetical protein FRC20_003899 [Serendipita sp. 405]KAG9022587.1 hypothetical protein FS842_006103 [Serendipita sp. 407]
MGPGSSGDRIEPILTAAPNDLSGVTTYHPVSQLGSSLVLHNPVIQSRFTLSSHSI